MFSDFVSDYRFEPMSYENVIKVVDDADFLPDSELVRALRVSGSGASDNLLYDYDDGVVPENDTVTNEVLALRSGRLDKAEVQTMKDALIRSGVDMAKQDKTDAINKAIGDALGVSD